MNHKRFWNIAATFTEEEEEAESEGIPILHDTKWAAWSRWVASQVTLQMWWSGPLHELRGVFLLEDDFRRY